MQDNAAQLALTDTIITRLSQNHHSSRPARALHFEIAAIHRGDDVRAVLSQTAKA